MFVALCVVVALLAIGFVLGVREQDVPPLPKENPELKHLQERRAALFENLKDLQFEYLQGKLSEEDYQSLKTGFQNDLAVVLASIDMQANDMQANDMQPKSAPRREIAANAVGAKAVLRDSQSAQVRCSSCGADNPPSQRFCGSCGAKL